MNQLLAFILFVVFTMPAIGADRYQPAPLQLLTEKVEQHDQRLDEIDQRVSALERKPVEEPQEPVTVAYVEPAPKQPQQARRLKTTAELKRDLRANWTSTVYADVKPRSWAKRHLVADHGYAAAQVNGLTQNEAWMLHNLAHVSSERISAYTGSNGTSTAKTDQPAVAFAQKAGGCPNGQCRTQSSRTTQRSTGWRPGLILFGR